MSIRKILYGLEYVFDGLICDHITSTIVPLDNGKIKIVSSVRKWHPSYWLGYIRCVWLGDKCGSAHFFPEKPSLFDNHTSVSHS